MDSIHSSQVKQLSLDQVAKIVPESYKHICINDAQSGMQPSETYIVGALQDNHEKFVHNSRTKKRMTLREVLPDGTQGLQIDVFAYNKHADAVDNHLKGAKTDAPIWLVFAQVRLEEYHGHHEDGWCKFGLRAGEKVASDARVWFVTQAAPTPPPPLQKATFSAPPAKNLTTLTSISSCCKGGTRVNMCAVVKTIVKQPVMTNKGSFHILLALVDPSCLAKGAIREDLLLHVFLNDGNYRDLPGGVEVGDILFLRSMVLDQYKGNMHGKVFDIKQVVKFSSDTSSPVSPVTVKTDYILTDDIRAQVLALREWWIKSRNLVNPNPYEQAHAAGASPDAAFMPECTLGEVEEQRAFTLYCQILEKRGVKATAQFFILRIQDGSPTKLQFTQFDLQNTTLELMSQSECYRGIGSFVVDVLVTNPTKVAFLAEAGDFIQMKNVRCIENRSKEKGDFDHQTYDLTFDGRVGEMVQLPRMHSEVCKIIERLAKSAELTHNETHSFCTENDTATAHATRSLVAPSGSSLLLSSAHSSPKLPSHTDSLEHFIRDFRSQNDQSRSQATQENDKEPSYNSHPHNTMPRINRNEDIADDCSVIFPPDLPTSTQNSQQPSHHDVTTRSNVSHDAFTEVSGHSVTTSEEFYNDRNQNSVLPPVSPSGLPGQSSHHSSGTGPQTTNKTAKRKIDLTDEVSKTVNHSRSNAVKVETTIHEKYTDTTITELLAVSTPGTLYRVRANVVNLQYLASQTCPNCKNNSVCVHTWVWGLCEKCGELWDFGQLLKLHSRKHLMEPTLDCFICSEQLTGGSSAEDRATTSTKGRGTVVPLFRLFLLLKDSQTKRDCLFHLSGDNAKKFWGMAPKFSWIIQDTDQQLSDLINGFLDAKEMLYFGVERCLTSQESVQYHITHTSLKLAQE